MQYLAKIEKETIQRMPVVQLQGQIVVVKSKREADAAVEILSQAELIGFDTETRPNFSKFSHHTVSLVQLATSDVCFLFRLNFIGQHQGLKALLENENVTKVGLSVKDDFHSLRRVMPLEPRGFIELQTYVKQFGIEEQGLQKIYAIVFGRKISKSQQLSNWEAPILSEQQKAYAAIDAWSCRDIYLELQKQEKK